MNKLTKNAEKLLREIISHRDEKGVCDSEYWKKQLEPLPIAEVALIHSIFDELADAKMISYLWADIHPYFMVVLNNGLSYFDEKEEELVQNNNYTNNFYGDANAVQIQQGTTNSTQKQNTECSIDEKKISEFLQEIRKHDDLLEGEFGEENAEKLRALVRELANCSNDTKSEEKKRSLFTSIKEICVNAGSSILAAGIIQLITNIIG